LVLGVAELVEADVAVTARVVVVALQAADLEGSGIAAGQQEQNE
jgi:hypothetical protein